MKLLKISILLMLLFMLAGCQPSSEPTNATLLNPNPLETQAQMDLVTFFEKLNQKQYEDAITQFGGSYEVLQGYNPDIDPEDKATLLKFGCEFNGLTCLQVYDAELKERISENEFLFNVRFRNPDGEVFVLGPCCGATEEEMPPVSTFEIHVTCDQEQNCQVLELPPYVP